MRKLDFNSRNYSGLRQAATVTFVFAFFFSLIFALAGCGRIPSTGPYLAEDRDSCWVNDIAYLENPAQGP